MYKLTNNPDMIVRTTDGAHIPRGHRFWEEYEEWLLDPANTVTPADVTPLSELRNQAKVEIDQVAESIRAKYLTPGSGQAMTYMKKVADAEKFNKALAAYNADRLLTPPIGVVNPETVLATTYPWVNSEVVAQVTITGQQAAADILAQDSLLNSLGAQIEAIRRSGKIVVDSKQAATTINVAKLDTITQLQAL